jgi:hypothetical protein
MNARYYDPVLGSFISPDTVVPEPGQPEGYNRYAYANGNPLRFSDPSGHCAENTGYDNPEAMECWRWAETIMVNWDKTDFFQHAWPSGKESWRENIASNPLIESDFMKLSWTQYQDSGSVGNLLPDFTSSETDLPRFNPEFIAGVQWYGKSLDYTGIGLATTSLVLSIGQTAAAACAGYRCRCSSMWSSCRMAHRRRYWG